MADETPEKDDLAAEVEANEAETAQVDSVDEETEADTAEVQADEDDAPPSSGAGEASDVEAEAAVVEQPQRRRRAAADPQPAKAASSTTAAPEAPAKPASQPSRQRRQPSGEPVFVSAKAKYVRSSARKARLVCDQIRGKDVVEARAILQFTPRHVAEAWQKLLESAVANAEHNHDLVGEELKIHSVFADEGPTLKRFRPRAMGRATRIRKRTAHLSITLTQKGA